MADEDILLRVAADTTQANAALTQLLDSTRKRALDVETAAERMNVEFSQIARVRAFDALTAGATDAITKGKSLSAVLESVNEQLAFLGASDDEIRGVARALSAVQRGGGSAPAGRGGGSRNGEERVLGVNRDLAESYGDLSSSMGALRALVPGVAGEILNFGEDLTQLGEYIPRAAAGVKNFVAGLNAASIGLLVASAALAVGVAAFSESNRQASQTVSMLIASQDQYYRTIVTGSRDQLEAALLTAQTEVEINRARIAENRAILTAFEEEVTGAGRAFADLFDLGGAQKLRVETQNLEASLSSQEFLVQRYTLALEGNLTAIVDAEAEERELAAARLASANTMISTWGQLDSATTESARAMLDALASERARTISLIAQNIVTREAMQARLDEIDLIQNLVTAALPNIAARAAEAAAVEKETAALQEIKDARTAAVEAAREYAEQIGDLDAQRLSKRVTDEIEAARKEQRQLEDFIASYLDKLQAFRDKEVADAVSLQADLTAAGSDAAADQFELIEKNNADREKSIAAHEKKLRDIRLNLADQTQDAFADRNFAVARRAIRDAKQATDAEVENYNTQEAEREKSFEKELSDLRANLSKEQQELIAAYNTRRADAQAALQREQSDAINGYALRRQREEQDRQYRYAQENGAWQTRVGQLQGHLNRLETQYSLHELGKFAIESNAQSQSLTRWNAWRESFLAAAAPPPPILVNAPRGFGVSEFMPGAQRGGGGMSIDLRGATFTAADPVELAALVEQRVVRGMIAGARRMV